MSRLSKPNRRAALFATLASGFLVGGLMLAAAPALADDDHRRHPHHHHHHGGKQVFYDGACKVERKWNGHGGYKEEVKCRPSAHAYYYPPPSVVAYYPPPPPPVYVGPPMISVVIPIGR